MKKYIFIILIISVLISCNTNPTDKLLSDTNNFINDSLLIQLKDPKSFEKIDLKITDTIKESEELKEILDLQYSDVDEVLAKNYAKFNWTDISDRTKYKLEYNKFLLERDSIKNLVKKSNKDKISKIVIVLNYRAKNSFGALDFGRATIYFYPNEIDVNKKFFIYNLNSK